MWFSSAKEFIEFCSVFTTDPDLDVFYTCFGYWFFKGLVGVSVKEWYDLDLDYRDPQIVFFKVERFLLKHCNIYDYWAPDDQACSVCIEVYETVFSLMWFSLALYIDGLDGGDRYQEIIWFWNKIKIKLCENNGTLTGDMYRFAYDFMPG